MIKKMIIRKVNHNLLVAFLTLSLMCYSCSSEKEGDLIAPCEITDLALSVTDLSSASCGVDNGSVLLSASGGEMGYMFSIDNGEFVLASEFTSLSAGNYTFTVVDNLGCTVSLDTTVNSTGDLTLEISNSENSGFRASINTGVSLSQEIESLIVSNCATSGCHDGAISPNLSTASQIIDRAGRIKARTENKTMPPSGNLPQAQIDAIACWVEDGALDN